MIQRCAVCSEENVEAGHEQTRKHLKNVKLDQLSKNKKNFSENRNGLIVLCTVCPTAYNAEPLLVDNPQHILKASIQPRAEVKFSFNIRNDNDHNIVLDGVTMLPTNIVHFNMVNNNMGLGTASRVIPPRSNFGETVEITFENAVVGVYKMPVFFFFSNEQTDESTIIIKEMLVFIEAVQKTHEKVDSVYTGESVFAERIVPSTIRKRSNNDIYQIPSTDHKVVFSRDLKTDGEGATDEQKALADKIKAIFAKGPTQENYTDFYHNLLWFDETVIANNLKNYNMTGVTLFPRGKMDKSYALRVPGLAEKRPSLMIGDLAHVRPNGQTKVLFEAIITEIEDNFATFAGLNREFKDYYNEEAKFDVRFFMSRLPQERMHAAVHAQPQHAAERAFPRASQFSPPVKPITRYYNELVANNPEQRAVVRHIVAGTSGTAPYLLYGPPGTGKTVTIVEAILQLASKPKNQILVCTDSNKAADHVASMLIQYMGSTAEQFILRANSEFRVWESFPAHLAPYSNGTNRGSWYSVPIHKFRSHRIVITTLIHAAKFAGELKKKKYKVDRVTTHIFVDEAAQASEPATLVPVCGLLAPAGQLVLAGDPMQLGPVVISREAGKLGLGMSLMERLKTKWPLYANANPNYIMMLRKNFRSHPDILSIPDQLFYNNQLEALAPFDAISQKDILSNDANAKSRAIVFHGVLSKEQRIGKSPSFYNSMELEIVQSYITALVVNHRVALHDIGVIAPYIRQVYKIKKWLIEEELEDIEVGTVEGFQGKEKRVMIISTVRANCDLFAHDAKFRLGFVADAKRFNVALTRAKAKLIVIGNPLCLKKDPKWTLYMQKCRDFGTYTGFDGGPFIQEENDDAIFDQLTSILSAMTKALANIRL